MQIELPDVRESIIAQDVVDRPALIVVDGNASRFVGIGKLTSDRRVHVLG